MQGAAITYGLLTALAIALLVAACTDWRRRQIDNWLNAAIALAAPLYWWAMGYGLTDIGWQLGVAVITFAVTAMIFAWRGMGGGDVKLLTALALWIPPMGFMELCMVMALLGGMLTLVTALPNMERRPRDGLRVILSVAAALLWIGFSAYWLYVLSGGTPVDLIALLPAGASIALGLGLFALVLTAIAVGAMNIIRNQRSKLPIPYGLAISAAGLWHLASQHGPAFARAIQTG